MATPTDATNFTISEINYHPYEPTLDELAINPAWTDEEFEFVEVTNTSDATIQLTGLTFSAGIGGSCLGG